MIADTDGCALAAKEAGTNGDICAIKGHAVTAVACQDAAAPLTGYVCACVGGYVWEMAKAECKGMTDTEHVPLMLHIQHCMYPGKSRVLPRGHPGLALRCNAASCSCDHIIMPGSNQPVSCPIHVQLV